MDGKSIKWSEMERRMNRLTGKFDHTIDAKGRFIVPSKFREDLGDSFTVTIGLDGCLYIFPESGWDKFTEQLEQLNGTKENRTVKRTFLANAASCDIDKQGRTLIPANLREWAGIDKDIVLVGLLNKIELWSKERFEASNSIENIDEMAENLANLGITF